MRSDVITNDKAWEGVLIEGAALLKRGDYWYLFYSGSGCCGLKWDYAVGVARSKELLGPWKKNPAIPMLKGTEAWSCPGHGSLVKGPRSSR